MSAKSLRSAHPGWIVVACMLAAGCTSVNDATSRFASSITPYKVEVVQGNFVSREQVEALKPGMTRLQVRDLLGTPLVTSIFHNDRWDYVFTIKRQGVDAQARKLTVYFKGDALDRFEGDPMPSEADFVAQLDSRRAKGSIPVLEASEDKLKAFATPSAAANAAAAAAAPAAPVVPVTYPPLEPAR